MCCSSTEHGRLRCAQRGISPGQVQVARKYGRKTYQLGGRVVYYIGKRELARLKAAGKSGLERYRNLAAVFTQDGVLITTFRSADYRKIRLINHGRKTRSKKSRAY